MSYTFLDLVIEVLKHQHSPMSVIAMWNITFGIRECA